MNFQDLVTEVLFDLLESLGAFRLELALCATIVVLLLVRMIAPKWEAGPFCVTLIGAVMALYPDLWDVILGQGPSGPKPIFTGLLVSDQFSVYMRFLLLVFLLLFTIFTWVTGVPGRENATEFYVLVLGATLGMCLMVSANHMLIVFLGIEMASVPSYVLAGLLKHRRRSSEAALKYAVFGAASAGVMLYGISLLVGVLGSAHLPTMAVRLAQTLLDGGPGQQTTVLVLGGLMLTGGLAFKLSAVPFHFWAPDVFEGATAEVAAFLSIASKAAALGLLVRLALGFGYVDSSLEAAPLTEAARRQQGPAVDEDRLENPDFRWPTVRMVMYPLPGEKGGDESLQSSRQQRHRLSDALAPTRKFIAGLIALLAAVTCTFGNLAAYGQTNIKRLLAYSTIAHAGYMMMAVAAAVALAGVDPDGGRKAVAALAFYIGIYLFMNLGAFAVVAFLRNVLGSEAIEDYAGLIRRSPGLAVCMSIILFSLVGLPPLAGFAAKFTVFAALMDAGLLALLAVAGLNTVLSLFYYLRIVKVMILQPEPENRPAAEIPLGSTPGMYCAVLTLPLLLLGVWWNGLFFWAEKAAEAFLH